MVKLTEAKAKVNKKWNQNNKERVQYINKSSATKSFILNLATEEDLKKYRDLYSRKKNKTGY
mgnify:CR=1 FL=1